MRLLLDTHVLLWWLLTPERISADVTSSIADPANDVVVSAASVWEAAIKRALGKLDVPDDLEAQVRAAGFQPLPVTLAHAAAVAHLPFDDDHRDPFDRMLVVQAQTERLTLVTRDPKLGRYGVPLLPA